ncbi:hypothetical protein [Paracoccus indicus]|uniref:hypothetical protein n=1 Tax=Paracoccus indicus TaxID=2079229 RepID=UPI000D3B8085|nr:hypothetical protein [Paracoccus indicus]
MTNATSQKMPIRLSADERNEITAAMVGVIDRYCGLDPIDMPLARELGAECCRIIEARDRSVRGRQS